MPVAQVRLRFISDQYAPAERIVETCEGLAQKEGVGVSIYILDNDGNHVYMDRMDGQNYLGIVTAEMKARTALADFRRAKPSATIAGLRAVAFSKEAAFVAQQERLYEGLRITGLPI